MSEEMKELVLENAQRRLEEEAIGEGTKRYWKMIEERGLSESRPGIDLIKGALEPFAEAIRDYTKKALSGKALKGAGSVHMMAQMEPEELAFLAARRIIISAAIGGTVQYCAKNVVTGIEQNLSYSALREKEPGLYRQLQRKIAKSSHAGYRFAVLRKQMKFAGIIRFKWEESDQVRLGTALLHLFAKATGLVEVSKQGVGKHSRSVVTFTESAAEWLSQSHARCELLTPLYLPMVVKPREWTTPFNGGYLDKRLRLTLIKTSNRNYLEELRHVEMPMVYTAVNAMQNTAWRINQGIYSTMSEAWDAGGDVAGLPARDNAALPPKDFPTDATNDDPRVKAWRRKAAQVYDDNASITSKRVAMVTKLWVAEKMLPYSEFFYPHALDWRGRAYAVGSFLNPQGDDSAKALIEFAEGKPLGDNGVYWLAVHGANCFGVDKVSFEERVDWVSTHEQEIVASAMGQSQFWTTADSPWQFLAFCKEWAGMLMCAEPEQYVSHLPVSWDGACNGLQNFSAMLRDEVGGAATGLVPGEKPADVYAQVAQKANEIARYHATGNIENLMPEDNDMGKRWVGKFTRPLTKRNTMTVPYGVSAYGMRDQVADQFKKMRADGEVVNDGDLTFEDAIYVANTNRKAISEVVVASRKIMDWLQGAASVAAKGKLPVIWTTPTGLKVVQNYRAQVGKRLDFEVLGQRYRLMLKVEGSKLDGRKQSSGISPNFVHSLDAAHLQRTISYCVDAGIGSFAMVHDSYGTHAGDADTLRDLLRRAFVDQYTPDVLGQFRAELVEQLDEELAETIPALPSRGTLDLNAVLDSEYFFA